MDLLSSKRVYQTIQVVDREGTEKLNSYVNDLAYRNKNYFVNGFGGSGGKMIIRIKYRLLQHSEIERTITAKFVTDFGEEVSSRSTIIVEKVPQTIS